MLFIDTFLICTHVKDDDMVMHCKINRSTQMKKVMNAFYVQQKQPRDSLRFYYNGNRISEDSTIVDVSYCI